MALDYGHQKADDDLKALEKKIIAGYTPVKQEISDKITKYLESFKKQDDEKIRQLKNNEITEKEYLDWRKNTVMGTSRWEQLDKVLAKDISNANQIATKMTSGTVADVYALNANFGIYEIEKDTGANISFTLYDKKTVERMIKDDEFPIVPRMDIPKDQRWNAQKINSAMLQGILSGDSIPDIAKRLRGVTDMNISASIRNARTYVTGAENRGRIDSYKYAESLGLQRDQIWLATIDDRTRASHIALDKERVDIGEKFSNGCEYPGDPNGAPEEIYNCRCTLVSCKKGKPFNDVRNVSEEDYEKWKHSKEKEVEQPKPEINLDKFKKVFSEEEMQRFTALLDDAPNRKLYEMYADVYDVKKGSGECNWRTNTVTVQIEKERVDKGIPEFNTTAHELGHEFDKLLFKNEDIQNNFHFSEIETIKDGCKFSAGYSMNKFNTEMQTISKSDEFMDALRKDRENLKPLLQPYECKTPEETETFERLMRWYNISNTQIGHEIFYNELEQKVNTANAIGFQDTIDGMFHGSRSTRGSMTSTVRWGHGDAYYNDNYNNLFYGKEKDLKQTYKDLGFDASNQSKVKDLTRLYGATNEIFANVNSAVTNKGSDLEFFELYMPNYMNEYKKMMEVVNGKK